MTAGAEPLADERPIDGVDEPPLSVGASVIARTDFADDDLSPKCVVDSPSFGVWYTVIGNGSTLEASTCSPETDFDTVIQVFCGSCGDLNCVTGNDDSDDALPECDLNGLNRLSLAEWCSEPGTEYLIKVGGWNGDFGAFELTIADLGSCSDPIVCAPPIGRCDYMVSECPADFDQTGSVGFTDLTAMLGNWGTCDGPCPWDLVGNGSVGFADLTLLLGSWGPCPVDNLCADATAEECAGLGGTWDENLSCSGP